MIGGIVSMLVGIGFSRLSPWFLKLAIDELEQGAPMRRVMIFVGAMLGVALVGALFLYLQRWLLIGTSRRIEYLMRTDLFGHVQGLDVEFFGNRKTGDLMAHFTNDLNSVRDVCGPGIMYTVQTTVMLAVSITLMVIIDPFLTLVAFAPFPLISLVTYFFGKHMYTYSRRVQDLFGVISSRVQEDLSGGRVIRAYAQEDPTAAAFNRLNDGYLDANMDVARLRGRFMAAMTGLAGCGTAIALLVGGRMVMNDTLTLGSLVAFTAYLVDMIWPVIAIGWVISIVQRGASAMSRLGEVLDAKPSLLPGPRTERPRPRLEMRSVTFRYPNATEDAVHDVSFRLDVRQTLGIVGRTGSGKSTLLKLILRFHDPTSGEVRLDGIDLRERDLQQVRSIVGYAPQDAFLFSRTLADNIAYGRPEAERGEIEKVTVDAQLMGDVEGFPRGFETIVGERGVTLSGGQRQRTSLARALLTDPELLLLDDTLSAVDAETEEKILEALRRIMRERTSVIVSHRISAVKEADWILVLEEGRVTEEGTHADLLATGGLYSRLHERQKLAAEIDAT